MYNGTYFELMAHYNRWMNRNLYAICAKSPDADRRKNLGAFFRSVHGTLNHILYGDKAWMGRFIKEPFSVKVMGQDLYGDFAELREDRENTDQTIIEWAARLDSCHAHVQSSDAPSGPGNDPDEAARPR